MSILQTTDLKKYYGTEPNITKALDGVTLSIEQGKFVAIVGTSGSGKSTLLNMMGGLDVPTSGSVQIKGKELSELNDEQLTIFRRRNIGFIFQNYNLVPVLNVYENIVLPVELDGDTVDEKFMDEVVRLLALGGQAEQYAQQPVRRTAAARRYRPRPRFQARHRSGRRTDRQSGQPDEQRCAGTFESDQQQIPSDAGDDYPQQRDRPACRPYYPH